ARRGAGRLVRLVAGPPSVGSAVRPRKRALGGGAGKTPRLSISSTVVRRASRGSVHNPVRKVGHPRPPTRRRYGDALHDDREGQQGFGGGSSSRREDAERHGEVRRRAGEGGGDARRGGAAVEHEGHAHPVL